jgi:hypothetical protein
MSVWRQEHSLCLRLIGALVGYGSKTLDPVVILLSRSRWALATSASA